MKNNYLTVNNILTLTVNFGDPQGQGSVDDSNIFVTGKNETEAFFNVQAVLNEVQKVMQSN